MVKLLVSFGSYEKTVSGIDYVVSESNQLVSRKLSFAIPAHIGYVKAIASGPKFLVSGSTDETIRIFDLRRRKDFGNLTCHSGSVSCLAFFKQNMMFSAGEDGKIIVTRCADWEVLHTLRGHTKGVTALGIHPSGKLALSSGKDKSVKTWNLVTGKIALKVKNDIPIDKILWSPLGSYYLFLSERKVKIFMTDGAQCVLEHQPNRKYFTACFLSEKMVVFGGEGTKLSVYDIQEKSWTEFDTDHKPRVKEIASCEVDGSTFLASGSSDGLVILWSYHKGSLIPIDKHNSSLRITCLTLTIQ